jgi:hypothetical protein
VGGFFLSQTIGVNIMRTDINEQTRYTEEDLKEYLKEWDSHWHRDVGSRYVVCYDDGLILVSKEQHDYFTPSVFVEAIGGHWNEENCGTYFPEGIAPCPAHEDRFLSLHVWTAESTGEVSMNCVGGCTGRDVYEAFLRKGIKIGDLYLNPEQEHDDAPAVADSDQEEDRS